MANTKKDIISQLRKEILELEGYNTMPKSKERISGLSILETAFPNHIFPIGAIHEFVCEAFEDKAATSGFIAGLLSKVSSENGFCLWISRYRKLFPPSLAAFGIAPEKVIFADVRTDKEVLWTMEEGLKCKGISVVIAEMHEITFAQSRRLQLAVEKSKVTGFILLNDERKVRATACTARWKITSLPSIVEDEMPGVGLPYWKVELLKVRNGHIDSWNLIWSDNSFQTLQPKQHKIIPLTNTGS